MAVQMINVITVPKSRMPFQPRPQGWVDPMWRNTGNPIIPRDAIPGYSNSIFNSAAVWRPETNDFQGVFRIDNRARRMEMHFGRSDDGINWQLNRERIHFVGPDGKEMPFEYGYDPRVIWFEEDKKYYIHWCNGWEGIRYPTIGQGWTTDFQTFHQLPNAFMPFNRNGVLLPRRIKNEDGKMVYMMYSRPSDNGHTSFGDIFLSESPDLKYWGNHHLVARTIGYSWQEMKIGGGTPAIETDKGWFMLFHGVLRSCNDYNYSMGGLLLNRERPWEVVARTEPYLLNPREIYELTGDVPQVTFPCSILVDEDGNLSVLYGAGDTTVCMAHGNLDELINYTIENSVEKKKWSS